MKVLFDFEVDDRFGYSFDEYNIELLDTIRDGLAVFLKPLEQEINQYNDGIVVIILSDKIEVLKNMNITLREDYNEHFPMELRAKIKDNLTYTKVLDGVKRAAWSLK